ncbi:MAG: hypothetical protein FJ191_03290 [Gammaproteobacteria bacterium]|nr:hypothetical protein [Gammaproteobacteria bacterium]
MHTLTVEQQNTLVQIINEEFGSHLGFHDFADKMLGMFEDIPGFETIPQHKAKRIVNQLWRQYRGQDS